MPTEDQGEQIRKIPVTIITGFLGSGKTTLLKRIVRECIGRRIAVIQNEVSEEMGIESAVLTDVDGNIIPDFFELPNGCICCSSKDDMIVTLENIVKLGRERIDYIVVETTGIADPCSVAEIFWLDNELGSYFFLDGIVTVVDCLNFKSVLVDSHFLKHAEVGRRQVAISDRIVVNKTDLVTSPEMDEVVALVTSLNPSAELCTTRNSMVSIEFVLDIGSFDSHKLSHIPHVPSSVDHVFIRFAQSVFDRRHLEVTIGEMLWESSKVGSIYRAKGLFQGVNEAGRGWFGLQAVGALFETTAQESADLVNTRGEAKFLFIGTNLDKELITHMLSDALLIDS